MGEIRALLPLMLGAAQKLAPAIGPSSIILAVAETVDRDEIKRLCDQTGVDVRQITGDSTGVMAASDLLFVASGTATLQAAIVGTPMVIVYKMPWMGYLIARLLSGTSAAMAARRICWPDTPTMGCIGLPNLIAGRQFIAELIQTQATPERLAAEARRILTDDSYRANMRSEMAKVRSRAPLWGTHSWMRWRPAMIATGFGRRTACRPRVGSWVYCREVAWVRSELCCR